MRKLGAGGSVSYEWVRAVIDLVVGLHRLRYASSVGASGSSPAGWLVEIGGRAVVADEGEGASLPKPDSDEGGDGVCSRDEPLTAPCWPRRTIRAGDPRGRAGRRRRFAAAQRRTCQRDIGPCPRTFRWSTAIRLMPTVRTRKREADDTVISHMDMANVFCTLCSLPCKVQLP